MARWSKSYKPALPPLNQGAQPVADWLYRQVLDVTVCGLPEGVHHSAWLEGVIFKPFAKIDPDWSLRIEAFNLVRRHPKWPSILERYQDRHHKGDRRVDPFGHHGQCLATCPQCRAMAQKQAAGAA